MVVRPDELILTPLLAAALFEHEEKVIALLPNGADPRRRGTFTEESLAVSLCYISGVSNREKSLAAHLHAGGRLNRKGS